MQEEMQERERGGSTEEQARGRTIEEGDRGGQNAYAIERHNYRDHSPSRGAATSICASVVANNIIKVLRNKATLVRETIRLEGSLRVGQVLGIIA
ncbi:hypothetical protein AMTR_s00159p00022480 [Amborella trichopoda]|uniref:Uncharacterized protein n=1 Tax=Amborella trichopoda TaxID=13333 RepID=W1PVJ1_AMBTC|nr:hypothetical protein AMTR_s00159p00022480 [Amborella trichopoda]